MGKEKKTTTALDLIQKVTELTSISDHSLVCVNISAGDTIFNKN
jgi:hypothetical protein